MEILAGFLIALAIGITGVGAGSITAPILILFFHQSASDAVTTALVFGTVVKLIATPIYMSRGHVNFRVLKFMALGGLPAVLFGSLVLNSLDQKALSRPVLMIVGVTVLLTATATLWRSLTPKIAANPVALKWMPWIVAPIGFEVGFSSAGAGALGTIVLMRFTSLIPAEVVGTDLAFGLLLSIFAGGIHASMTGVPWVILGKLLAGRDSGSADRHPADFGGFAAQNASGAVYLACLHRRTAIVAGHHGLRGYENEGHRNHRSQGS